MTWASSGTGWHGFLEVAPVGLARASEEAYITKHRDHGEMKLLPEAGGEN